MALQHPWTKVGDVWEQELGALPKFYAAIMPPEGQHMHWMIGATVGFSYTGDNNNVEAALKAAWTELRYRHPGLAIRPVGQKKVYEPVTGDVLATWLDASFKVRPDETADNIFARLTMSPHITLYYLPNSNQLMITSVHINIDGRGVLYLFDALFAILEHPGSYSFGDEPSRLPQTENDLLGMSARPSEKHVLQAQELLGRFVQEAPVGMPVADMTRVPSIFGRRELTLPSALSEMVVKACKGRGISVTSAWHAALVLGVSRLQKSITGKHGSTYVAFTNFDMRQFFPKGFDPATASISTYHTCLPFRIDLRLSRSFDQISREVNDQYKDSFGDGFDQLAPLAELFTAATATTGPPPSSTPVLSSLGVLDKFTPNSSGQHWKINDIWIADTMLSAEIEAFLWSWRGQIVLSGSYNTAFYSTADVDAFLKATQEELLKGLDISQ